MDKMEGEPEIISSPNINSVLKPIKLRMPLKEIVLSSHDDENTASRKRRVSFANVNKIKEFSSGAESLVVCHTPAYEEPFSQSSDSSYPGASGTSLSKHGLTTNIEDSTLATIDITSDSSILQSKVRGPLKLYPPSQITRDREHYEEDFNITNESSNQLTLGVTETLDLTKAVSHKILVGDCHSNNHQLSNKCSRFSTSSMDITGGAISHISFNNKHASIDSKGYAENQLHSVKPVVSNITNPYENTKLSLCGMDLTNIDKNYLSHSCNSNCGSKIANVTDKHHSSNLELTDVINDPNMINVSTMDSTFDMDFTRCVIKNDHTSYSTNMDFTDIITNEDPEPSEAAMDFTKPIHNVINDQNDANNENMVSDQSDLHDLCSSTSKPLGIEECSLISYKSSLIVQKCVSNSNTEDKEHFPSILTPPLTVSNLSCKFSLNCSNQTSCNEDEEPERRNSSFLMNISKSESHNLNESKKIVKNENLSNSKTVHLVTSPSNVRQETEGNLSLDVEDCLLPSLNIKEGKYLENKNTNIKTDIESVDCIYKVHEHACTTKESPSIELLKPIENGIKDSETLIMNKSLQKESSKIEMALNIDNSLNIVNYETVDIPSINICQLTVNNCEPSQKLDIFCLQDKNQFEIEGVPSKYPSGIETTPNISTTEDIGINKSIPDAMCKKNITITRGGSTMLYSTLIISDDDITEHHKEENINSICDIEDTSIAEYIPPDEQIKYIHSNFNLNGTDCCSNEEQSIYDCKDNIEPAKGGKRSFEVALESENDTEENPIKLMCIKPDIRVNNNKEKLNVCDQRFLKTTIKCQNEKNNDLSLTKSVDNNEILKKSNNSVESLVSDNLKYLLKDQNQSKGFLPSDIYYCEEKSFVASEPKGANEIKSGVNVRAISFESENIMQSENGMYICDLIPKWIKLQFDLDCNGFISTRIYKIICSERDMPIGEYLLNQIKSSVTPDHISELVQLIKEPRDNFLYELAKTLSFICKYHNGNLDDNMLTIEMNSCKKKFWLYVTINIKYPQMLSPTDINIHENNIGDIKLSLIRQIFTSIQRRNFQLVAFTEALMNFQF